jgi:transposase
MRTKGTAAELETCRRIGGRLLLQGKKLDEVADACGVYVSTVKRWKRIVRKKGLEGLAVKESPGREPKLGLRQRSDWSRSSLPDR